MQYLCTTKQRKKVMIYARLLLFAAIAMALVYYGLSTLQLFGVVQFTKAKIKWPQVLIPFFYFFKSEDKNSNKKETSYFK